MSDTCLTLSVRGDEPEQPAQMKEVIAMSVLTHASHHRPVPIVASLAVAAVIAGGTALGIAWHDSGASAAPSETPSLRTPTWQDSSKYDYYHGPNAPGVQSFHPPAAGGRVQVGQ